MISLDLICNPPVHVVDMSARSECSMAKAAARGEKRRLHSNPFAFPVSVSASSASLPRTEAIRSRSGAGSFRISSAVEARGIRGSVRTTGNGLPPARRDRFGKTVTAADGSQSGFAYSSCALRLRSGSGVTFVPTFGTVSLLGGNTYVYYTRRKPNCQGCA